MDDYVVTWCLTSFLQCTLNDNHVAPNVLFVSQEVRRLFLHCMKLQGGIARYEFEIVVYELHVRQTHIRKPGIPPTLPLEWRVLIPMHDVVTTLERCTELWERSWHREYLLHEDAWNVMPSLHDGSTCAYDFDSLLGDLGIGTLQGFHKFEVKPILKVVARLKAAERRYREFTLEQGVRRLLEMY